MKDLLKRELVTWLQYFLITCVAAVVGHYAWDSSQADLGTGTGESQINIWGMVVHMWHDYFLWILGTFIVVGALRLLLVLLLAGKTNAQPSKVDAAPNKSLDASGGGMFRIIIHPAMLD